MNYTAAIEFLRGLQVFGAQPGLAATRRLAALAGHPEERLRFIHVAGTNGKGSTCAMLESIYRAAGLRVGLFTSPHLVSFRERIQVDRQLISEAEAARLTQELRALNQGQAATLFEFTTVLALSHFARAACDLVIWETGLGGRLDATNIVTPLASVITNIALDHQAWLGDTPAKIAAEKAGIIKPGVPVLTASGDPDALAVIAAAARRNGAPLTRVGGDPAALAGLAGLPLAGDHQRINAALALATVQVLQDRIAVPAAACRAGLAGVSWPGRLQRVERPGGRTLLLDGAHNLAGAEALAEALVTYFPCPRRTLILGMLQDKDWELVGRRLAPLAQDILTVPVASPRTAEPAALADACRAAHPAARVRHLPALAAALAETADEDGVVVAGSLYLVGEALAWLGRTAAGGEERGLNEWRERG